MPVICNVFRKRIHFLGEIISKQLCDGLNTSKVKSKVQVMKVQKGGKCTALLFPLPRRQMGVDG
jgi:hypothetical protein